MKTPLFEDVVFTLEAWKANGKILAIFSSGSVQAQLQFFSYVRDGESTRDIKHFFAAHYDTVNAGPKLVKTSYEKICRELNHDVSKVTFLTDNVNGTYPSRICVYMKHPHHSSSLHVIVLWQYHSFTHHLIPTLYTPHSFLSYCSIGDAERSKSGQMGLAETLGDLLICL